MIEEYITYYAFLILESFINSCGIPLNTLRQTLLLNQDCSCGIAAILESRRCSQMASTGKLLKVKGNFVLIQLGLIIYC